MCNFRYMYTNEITRRIMPTIGASNNQRSGTIIVVCFHISPCLQQQLHHRLTTLLARRVKGGPAVFLVGFGHISTSFQECRHNVRATSGCSDF